MSESEEYPFTVRNVRGECHQLIDYVILAEFDIDTGSTVRHQYPNNIPDYKNDWFAEFMLPEGAHNRDSDFTYIFLNRDNVQIDNEYWLKPPHQRVSIDIDVVNDEKHFLYGINLVKTKHDSSVRRGAIVKAICVFSRYHFVEALKRPLDIALEKYFSDPSIDVLKSLYESLNAVDLSRVPRPNYMEQCLMRRGVHYEQDLEVTSAHLPQWWNQSLPFIFERTTDESPIEPVILTVPLYRTPDEVGDSNLSLLVKTFGENIMQVFHCILMRQRVLFVGYNHAAGDVAQMVFSAIAMVAPPMTNIVKRTYPYANLSDLSFLEVKGYIAGVTNPMFQQRDTWWDLLCVLDLPNGTGTIQSAEERRDDTSSAKSNTGGGNSGKMSNSNSKTNLASYDESPHYAADNRFIQGVISGINARLSEDWVRQQFFDYMTQIVNHTQDRSVLSHNPKVSDEKSRRFVEANALRVAALHSNTEFRAMPPHPWAWCGDHHDHTLQQQPSDEHASPPRPQQPPLSSPPGKRIPVGVGIASLDSPLPVLGSEGGIACAPHENTEADGVEGEEQNEQSNTGIKGDDAVARDAETIEPSLPTSESPVIDILASSAAGAVENLNIIANTAASLAAPFRRKASERHKDSGSLMKMYIRKLQFETGQDVRNETERYFHYLQKSLLSEASNQALLVMLPESVGGLSCIATGLFHSSPRVRSCATLILTKIQEYRSTKCAFHSLNKMFISAYERQHAKLVSGQLQREIDEDIAAVNAQNSAKVDENNNTNIVTLEDKTVVSSHPPATSSQSVASAAMELLDPNNLSSLLQSTLDGLLATPDSGADGTFNFAFSNTIDELDMIP